MNSCLPSRRLAFACLVAASAVCCKPPPASSSGTSTASNASTAGAIVAKEEVRIALFWDPVKGATMWKVGTKSAGSEAELATMLQDAAIERSRSSTPECPVVIDAEKSVPWSDVVATLNACKKAGFAKIDFASSEG